LDKVLIVEGKIYQISGAYISLLHGVDSSERGNTYTRCMWYLSSLRHYWA